MEKPIIQNCGNFCGNKNWYMFYCPKCKKVIQRYKIEENNNKCICGQEISFNISEE